MKIQYIISAFRNLRRNKLPGIINIAGLAIGLSTALFALMFSYHELTYEKCHENSDRIGKVITFGNFGAFSQLPTSFSKTAIDLPANFPEVTQGVCTRKMEAIVYKDNVPFNETKIVLAQHEIMQIFTYDFITGVEYSDNDEAVCLAESMAEKYFGNENPVGKNLKFEMWGKQFILTVSGVYKDLPGNTHLKTDALISWSVAKQILDDTEAYNSTDYDVYCLLSPHTEIKELNQKIASNLEIPVQIEDCVVALMPIKDYHLNSVFENNKANLYILFIGGIIALLIAILNYVSQSSIMYTTRMQEVGVRLSNGGKSRDIFNQFMTDTAVVSFLGFALALMIVQMVLPYFNDMLDTDLSLLFDASIISLIVVLFLVTVLISGFYPSLIMSRVKPIMLLRSSISNSLGKSRMRNTISTMQFVFAIMLIQLMIVTQKQGNYMETDEVTGYNADNVISITGWQWGDLNTVKSEVLRNTAVKAVTWSKSMPAMQTSFIPDWGIPGNKQMANIFNCEADFLNLFQISMDEGRFFSKERETDKHNSIVVNQSMVSHMGWENPVGQQLMVYNKMYTVIGVVSDYMAAPPIFETTPLIIRCSGDQANYLIFRIDFEREKEAYAHITEVLRKANPNYPVSLMRYEDYLAEGAKTFYTTATLINVFVFIIILNAFLSLFGLSYFMAERNKKQIGINKIFGASVATIYWKLSKSLIIRFVIAFLIITPVSYLISKEYISTFTYQMPLSADIFILSGILVLMMLLFSTGYKIITAAKRNPVESLRYE